MVGAAISNVKASIAAATASPPKATDAAPAVAAETPETREIAGRDECAMNERLHKKHCHQPRAHLPPCYFIPNNISNSLIHSGSIICFIHYYNRGRYVSFLPSFRVDSLSLSRRRRDP